MDKFLYTIDGHVKLQGILSFVGAIFRACEYEKKIPTATFLQRNAGPNLKMAMDVGNSVVFLWLQT